MNTTTTSRTDQTTWGEREYRMALTVWAEPGNTALGEWIDTEPIDQVIARIRSHDEHTTAQREIGAQITERLHDAAALERAFDWLDQRPDARFVIPGDPEWPTALNDLGDARPYGLWVRGDLRALATQFVICIGGCRASTGYGDHIAGQLAADLSTQGYAVVTGAAYGIQGAATRAALSAASTPIVILAGGLDRTYPHGHTDLIDRVADRAIVISENPPGAAPTRARFQARNRLMAALANATVIVEAGVRSGSLATARHAAALFRPVGVVPGPVTSAASAGCHQLLRETDAFIVTGAWDIIEELES